ncbi:hypothetical protein [Cohnella sp. GbtcB17]|uniref:hypothetical protein n=1 Tax=Cohnella sp. GbtcB17 TaxID=2824762 RepID=UPI001C2FB220|nr:hypothetical protein [Cohnella sp. GbtcB17]
MLKNGLDKNGNKLKGATVIARFVKENEGLEAIVKKAFQAGYLKGRQDGARESAMYVATLFQKKRNK